MKIQTKLIILIGANFLLHIGLFAVSCAIPFSSSHKMLVFSMIFLTLTASTILVLNHYLLKPLKILSQSLLYRNYEVIDRIAKEDNSELGDLANMMLSFFKQRNDLLIEISERKQADEKAQQNILMQRAINNLLSISVENISIEDKLKFSLLQLFAISWMQLEERGALFLSKKQNFQMHIQLGLEQEIQMELKKLYESENILQNTNSLKISEIFSYTGNKNLNHLHIPLIINQKLTGFFVLFQKKEYKLKKEEKEFLIIAANITAEMIKRDEDEKEKSQIQLRLMQSSKMADIGKMAAGIAHEINNPLTIIHGNAQYMLLNDELVKNPEIKESFESISQATKRCRNIVSNLLQFSKQKNLEFNNLDINQLLEDSLKLSLFQKELKNITIVKEYSNNLPLVKGSMSHLGQVFLNIILNAGQAMPQGGTLTLKTKIDEQNDAVKIFFSDTGYGIDPEVVQNIFEPFFTTKERGTGLGLSVSYDIVKKHNGNVQAFSAGKGKGTTFIVSFPISYT